MVYFVIVARPEGIYKTFYTKYNWFYVINRDVKISVNELVIAELD
jgi:hypothetical protein